MKFAVAGCQHFHIRSFIGEMLELGHEFIGICDNSSYFLPEACAREYGVPLVRRLEALLDKGADMIGNAAVNNEKIDVIEWGEKHGIHVMTDKPIAIDYDGLRRLKGVMDRRKIKVGMMLTERFSPPLYTLKRMIEDGLLGDIYDFTFLKPHKLNRKERPEWFFRKSANGGLIIDIMIHDIDLLKWFTNAEIVEFSSRLVKNGYREYPEFYDNAVVDILTEDAVTATLKADWHMPEAFDTWGDGRIFVSGSKGRVEIRSGGDVMGTAGDFIMLAAHDKKAERYESLKVPIGLSEDFINQIQNKSHQLTAGDIYQCNKTVLDIDTASVKVTGNT